MKETIMSISILLQLYFMASCPSAAVSLQMFVDELPDMPKIRGYISTGRTFKQAELVIGMFETKWKFHRDLPPSTVFAFGVSKETATVPGPTIEAMQGVHTFIRWENHLPSRHILPWDPTVMRANPKYGGIPTVVHLHGGIHEPQADGNPLAWFTADFRETGPAWKQPTYHYNNVQQPGNLWYHDHAFGFVRVNVLAGLVGAYVIRNPKVELPLNLPTGPHYDRHLIIFDRSFNTDGSIYMNSTGNNPSIHPQWQPEYFGDTIIVNGKAWPFMTVTRRKYRFRIVNGSNARFYRLALSNGLSFTFVGSDSVYLSKPVIVKEYLIAPSEIADVVIDFSLSSENETILTNSAAYPYPSGDPVDDLNSKIMKFFIKRAAMNANEARTGVPEKLLMYGRPRKRDTIHTRYITMYEYQSATGEPTHLLLNALRFDAPVTETPKQGSTEIWNIINLTEDNHPLHIHLALFFVVEQREIVDLEEFKDCMEQKNDAIKCNIENKTKVGKVVGIEGPDSGWKNVYKMEPGLMTTINVQFSLLSPGRFYPFNASAEPGYVYHCHILDHEDNEMMRPLKIL